MYFNSIMLDYECSNVGVLQGSDICPLSVLIYIYDLCCLLVCGGKTCLLFNLHKKTVCILTNSGYLVDVLQTAELT